MFSTSSTGNILPFRNYESLLMATFNVSIMCQGGMSKQVNQYLYDVPRLDVTTGQPMSV